MYATKCVRFVILSVIETNHVAFVTMINVCFDNNCFHFIMNEFDDDDGEDDNGRGHPPGGPAERGDQLSEAEGPDDLPARGREHPLPVFPQVGPTHSSARLRPLPCP